MIRRAIIYSLIWILLCSPIYGAEVVRYVNTGSAAAGDGTTDALSGGNHAYQSQSIAYAAEVTDLTSDGNTLLLLCARTGGGGRDTTLYDIAGFNTSAPSFITVRATDFPADGIFDDSTYTMHNNDSGLFFDVSEPYVRYENMQWLVTGTGANTRIGVNFGSSSAASDCRVTNCIFEGDYTGTGAGIAIRGDGTNLKITVTTTVINDFRIGADADFFGIAALAVLDFRAYNTTIWNCYYGCWDNIASTTFKNCAVGNCFDDFLTVDSVDFCCTDDGDGTNSNGPVSLDWDNEFVDANNGDFTPVPGGNILVAGLNDPGSGSFSTDIIGEPFVTDSWSRNAYAGTDNGVTTGFHIISKVFTKDYWGNFFQNGIKDKWKMAA